MPTWIKVAIDAWATIAGIADGSVFRSVNRAGAIRDTALSEKVVWQLIRPYAEAAGVAGIAPHDCRRTCAKLCGAARGELEQIQMLLGHASVQTTERYLGTKQDLVYAPNDGIQLREWCSRLGNQLWATPRCQRCFHRALAAPPHILCPKSSFSRLSVLAGHNWNRGRSTPRSSRFLCVAARSWLATTDLIRTGNFAANLGVAILGGGYFDGFSTP